MTLQLEACPLGSAKATHHHNPLCWAVTTRCNYTREVYECYLSDGCCNSQLLYGSLSSCRNILAVIYAHNLANLTYNGLGEGV